MNAELYEHWSHRNFTAGQWREAAKRYLELQVALNETLAKDNEIHRDCENAEDFLNCELCTQLAELTERNGEFARAFANLWAIRALAVSPQSSVAVKGDTQ